MNRTLASLLLALALCFVAACRPVTDPGTVTTAGPARANPPATANIPATESGAPTLSEQIVTFENAGATIVGTLALPEAGSGPYPVALLLHGFTNERNELPVGATGETMYGRLARELGAQGIASLRIDFRGSGESDGAWADTTFTGQLGDAQAAVDYLSALPAVDVTQLGVVGFSQGGLIAAELAAQDDRVRSLVLWSPVASAPDTYKHILGDESVAAGLVADAPLPVTTQWGAQFELNRGFFVDLFRYDPTAAIAAVEAPLLVIVGLRDTTVTPQPAYGELYLAYHDGAERLVTLDSDHVFNVLTDAEPTIFDGALAWSTTWLADTLLAPKP